MFLIMWQKRFSENENEAVETHLHDIWIPRPKSRNIEIPRHFFRVQKATTSRLQDIEIPRPKSHDMEFLQNFDPYAP